MELTFDHFKHTYLECNVRDYSRHVNAMRFLYDYLKSDEVSAEFFADYFRAFGWKMPTTQIGGFQDFLESVATFKLTQDPEEEFGPDCNREERRNNQLNVLRTLYSYLKNRGKLNEYLALFYDSSNKPYVFYNQSTELRNSLKELGNVISQFPNEENVLQVVNEFIDSLKADLHTVNTYTQEND